ncbi:nucleotide disphospho-sugar-binding domain-containing protein [Streptomyces sp. NPDC004658]|uniref:nucleotide disphospho-sugar-binding domain-containing protein n=1 Tax=Streptomyces sp. NPDC004658 TaxID=3154672 RepID=UPI0033B4BB4A
MTRVLFTTAAMAAHVRPTVPLVKELVDGGHDVAWYTGPEFEDVVTRTGARFLAARAGADFGGALARTGGKGRGFSGLNRLVLELFLKPIPAYARELADVFDTFRPDVVVSDHSFRAGLLVAEQRGIPRVAFSAGPLNLSSRDTAPFGLGWQPSSSLPGRLRNRVMSRLMYGVVYRERQRVLGRIRAEMGLPALGGYSIDWVARTCDRYLQTGVPEFEYPRSDLPPSVEFIGPTQPEEDGAAPRPQWWPEVLRARAAGRPVVFVTQGTIATGLSRLVLPTIEALAGQDVLVVATTSGQDPETVLPAERRPQHVLLAPFVPYGAMLPLTDVLVTNGGYGGVQHALSHGVPLVVSGTSEDRMETNARVVWAGVGVSLRTDTPSVDRLRQAVDTVLRDPSYRARARSVQRALASLAGTGRAAAAIVEAAAAGRTPAGGV